MKEFVEMLKGGDLRALREPDAVVDRVRSQDDFDALFKLLFHHDRVTVMRAADAIEKITRRNQTFLSPHRGQILELIRDHANIELKWHLAQLVPRLALSEAEVTEVWARLKYWVLNRAESKLVRVHALQGLFDIMQHVDRESLKAEFRTVVRRIETENIPSLDARIRKLRRQASRH